MSFKEKYTLLLMRFGVSLSQNEKMMNWVTKKTEKKKEKQLQKDEKMRKTARSRKLVTDEDLMRTNHALRQAKYEIKELTKLVNNLQKKMGM